MDQAQAIPSMGGMVGASATAEGKYDPPRFAQRLNLDNVEHAFTYQTYNEYQLRRETEVTAALIYAAKAILQVVPECPTRTRALNNLVDAWMLAKVAIMHGGRY